MFLKDFPFIGSLVKSNTGSDVGCLVVDTSHKVLAVNAPFHNFQKLYNDFKIDAGEYLREKHFFSFPEHFISDLYKTLAGNLKKSIFQVEFLGDRIHSFDVSVQLLSKENHDLEGAFVTVKKREPKPLMPEIEQNEDFFKLLVENSTSVYQLANAALMFTYCSKGIESILGYTPDEVIGTNAIDWVHPDDKDNLRDWLIEVRRIPDKLLTCEYRIKNKQGDYTWIENNARNMLSNNTIRSIVMHFKNVQVKKIADHALIQAEQRLSLLLNNTEESFIILNSRLRIVTYNKAAQERSPFFYNAGLQSELSVLDLIEEEKIEEYINIFEDVFTGKEIEKESRFVDAAGGLHIYSHTFRPLFDQQNDIFGVFITSRDITERTKLTEEVALHSERLKTAQEVAHLGYFEYDMDSKTFFCSQQFYGILGISKSIKSWRELAIVERQMLPDEWINLKSQLYNSVNQGKEFNMEFRLSPGTKDEKYVLGMGGCEKNDEAKATKFRITLQDVTDSKLATLAIQTLESKFKTLFDNSIDGVILSNNDDEIISANPSICKLLGYSQNEMISLKRKNIIDLESAEVGGMIDVHNRTGSYIGELILKHKKGYFVPVEVTSICMHDANNHSYVSTIIRDITEKKKNENEQKLLTEELMKNNQDLQQFSFITSHNLRAPVANLLSLLSLYNKENHADEFNKLLIEKFEEATTQLNQTLNDLVNVLVIKSNNNIERETISLTSTFIDVKKNVNNLLLDKKGTISANFSKVDAIQYNRIHIESIFLNMITNAIRYSSPKRNLKIKVSSYREDNWIVISFADNGLGMDLNRYGDRLFGLYQRFHGNIEGKGLGLYMTRSQVIAMGGKIEVESEPDKGTTFKIYLKYI